MFWVAVIIIITSLIGVISTKFLGEDNPIEKMMEEIIRLESGVEIDFTPNHPDENPFIKQNLHKRDNFVKNKNGL
jgi:hypothetical protein